MTPYVIVEEFWPSRFSFSILEKTVMRAEKNLCDTIIYQHLIYSIYLFWTC